MADSNDSDSQRFIDCDENSVFDIKTRLMWFKKDTWQLEGKWLNWVQCRDFIDDQNKKRASGFSNWRFPTTIEAKSIFEKSQSNKDHMGQTAWLNEVFSAGFGFLCWTSEVRNKIQAVRFNYRKGGTMYDDVYRPSRGSTRLVRNLDKDE
jgi:hypothetical protein